MATHFNPKSLYSDTLSGLDPKVLSSFLGREKKLKQLLRSYQLEVFFLTDELRGKHVIRAYIQSLHFDKFTNVDRMKGGKYFGFCDIYKVQHTPLLIRCVAFKLISIIPQILHLAIHVYTLPCLKPCQFSPRSKQ